MLQALSFAMRHGLEVALVLAVLSIFLEKGGGKRLQLWSFLIALILSVPLAYNFNLLGGREAWSGVLGLFIGVSGLGLLTFRKQSIKNWLAAGLSFSIVLLKGADIALFPRYILLEAISILNSELLLIFAGLFMGLIIPLVVFLLLQQAWEQLSRWRTVTAAGVLLLVALGQLVTGVQVMVVYGIIPMYPWLLNILIPLINGQEKLFYGNLLFNLMMLAVVLQVTMRMSVSLEGNPAQKRKRRSTRLKSLRLIQTSLAALVLAVLVLGANAVYANRSVELSEALPVEDREGRIFIPVSFLQDNKLHRFGYRDSDGSEIRFIAIHKGSGIYGVGLDACEICGTTGYYQRKDDVICFNCDVVINIPTIGFPGGCNPIPLNARVEGDQLVLEAAELEKQGKVFAE